MKTDIQRLLIIVVVAVGLFVLYKHYVLNTENFNSNDSNHLNDLNEQYTTNTTTHPQIEDIKDLNSNAHHKVLHNKDVLEHPMPSNESSFELADNVNFTNSSFPKDQLTSADLLPNNQSHWEESNPNINHHLTDKNFSESGHHYGINTVGSSLRNANLQLRSDPPITMVDTGKWMQSTIAPDNNRLYFEIGGSSKF